jgi:two-component system phosphate regulon response regulator OmpR
MLRYTRSSFCQGGARGLAVVRDAMSKESMHAAYRFDFGYRWFCNCLYTARMDAAGRPRRPAGGAQVTAQPVRVLVVDDETDIQDMLSEYLGGHGYVVDVAGSGEVMRAAIEANIPDVVLLDVGLPGEDGLSLARYLRERYELAIIMVSGAGDTVDRIVGLELGADDYIAKPFDPRELLARVKSVVRRYQARETKPGGGPPQNRVAVGGMTLDVDARRLTDASGTEVPLTNMEFELLQIFAERPNRVLSRDQILNLTQNRDWDPFDRSVDIRIARLRRKIEPDPARPRIIRTVRGAGYMFVPGGGN